MTRHKKSEYFVFVKRDEDVASSNWEYNNFVSSIDSLTTHIKKLIEVEGVASRDIFIIEGTHKTFSVQAEIKLED